MKLSRLDRTTLANQFKILQKLYPDETDIYKKFQEIVEYGYEAHYPELFQTVNEQTVSPELSKIVADILDMFLTIQRSYRQLKDKSGIDEYLLEFQGFDGNERDEAYCISYARFLCNQGNSFRNLKKGDDFNSHMPTLSRYSRMVEEWKKSARRFELTKEDIIRITSI
jgi:uncharacterized protein YfbU (UPF0304 family)